jgi:predicted dehydrogenase
MKINKYLLAICFACCYQFGFCQEKLKVVLAGLSHDHVNRILDKNKNGDLIIIGIAEPDKQLCNRMKTAYQLPDTVFYESLTVALNKNHPDLVMVFNAPIDHLTVVETCLPLRIPVMIEKPLSFSNAVAARIKTLSEKFNTKVYTNFPSQWYTSFMELFKKASKAGTISKMVMRGGHRGPIEVGCSKEFVNWLTDSVKNGGGALTDFGCYGAAIFTQLMQGQAPISVYATTRHLKRTTYPKADDAATIVLEYANATGIIEASWNWPYTIMDVEVFGKTGRLHAAEFNVPKPLLEFTDEKGTSEETLSIPVYKDEVDYLTAVIKNGATDNNKLLLLEQNTTVVQILDAARKSVATGKKVFL